MSEVGKMSPLHTASFILQLWCFILYPSSLLVIMHLPTLPWSSNSQVCVEGDVSIDASAAIAPGVILRAAPDSKIVIAAGVCIGMGSVLHAHGGTLEVEAGANLGAGVLIVGKVKIGANACIGAVTTVLNSSIEPWQVVPAASVVGEKGRQIVEVSSQSTATSSIVGTSHPHDASTSTSAGVNVTPSTGALSVTNPVRDGEAALSASDSGASVSASNRLDNYATAQESLNGQAPSNRTVASNDDDSRGQLTHADSKTESVAEETSEAGQPVYGQGSLDRILKTLFPHNQSLNRPPEDG